MTISTRREEFDPKRDYVVARPFVASGVPYSPGQPYDIKSAPLRKVRALYEQRLLKMQPENAGPVTSETVAEVPLSLMDLAELRAWLTERGSIPRRNATRAQMLLQAEAVLTAEAEKAGEASNGGAAGNRTAEAA